MEAEKDMYFTPMNSNLMKFVCMDKEDKKKVLQKELKQIKIIEHQKRLEKQKLAEQRKMEYNNSNVTLTYSEYIKYLNDPTISILDFPTHDNYALNVCNNKEMEIEIENENEKLWNRPQDIAKYFEETALYEKVLNESKYGIMSSSDEEYDDYDEVETEVVNNS